MLYLRSRVEARTGQSYLIIVIWIIPKTKIYGSLPQNVRNEALSKLADIEETHRQIESIGVDKLPTNVRKNLGRL